MAEPALKLGRIPVSEKKILAGSMAAGLTAHPELVPTPKIPPAQLTALAQAVTDQELVVQTSEDAVTAQRDVLTQKVAALDTALTTSADHSKVETGGDRVKMELLNIPLKSDTAEPPDLSAPQNFAVTHGDLEGQVDGQCNRKRGAKLYRAEYATSPGGPWVTGYEGTKSSFTISNLPLGQECWFRISAFVGGVWTNPSDPAKCRVV